jgi:hypothetical protein
MEMRGESLVGFCFLQRRTIVNYVAFYRSLNRFKVWTKDINEDIYIYIYIFNRVKPKPRASNSPKSRNGSTLLQR